MAQTEFIISIDLPHPRNQVWQEITDFPSYSSWNSVLSMAGNDQLEVGKKFRVQINTKDGKSSTFRAVVLKKEKQQYFSAQQKILGKWFFTATHYFIVEEAGGGTTKFVQKWELTGIVSRLFKKMIFKQLEEFRQMNTDLKNHMDAKYLNSTTHEKDRLTQRAPR
ncbi:MAG: SRPBCC domain-containing protein [Bacteroidota bacterium]